jgi:hypothetical protein
MRTKTLLLAAALSAAGLATSMAQSNVYSLNVVGYINVPLATLANPNGDLNFIANQLDLDGTGSANTLASVLGNDSAWVSGTQVYGWDGAAWVGASFNKLNNTWPASPPAAVLAAVQVGNGFFLKNGTVVGGKTNLTLVGNVMQGALANPIPAGFSVVSSMVPEANTLTNLNLTVPQLGHPSVIYKWDSAAQGWVGRSTSIIGQGGVPHWGGASTDVSLAIAEAAFLSSASNTSWNRNFTVQ